MNKSVVLLLVAVLCIPMLVGCESLNQSSRQRQMRQSYYHDQQMKMLVDDIDVLLMNDRASRLSRLHMR